jgi:hypothetical protein
MYRRKEDRRAEPHAGIQMRQYGEEGRVCEEVRRAVRCWGKGPPDAFLETQADVLRVLEEAD